MILPIVFRQAAEDELDRAVEWYERQQIGLGIRLSVAVERVLARAANQPDFYPPIRGDTREGIVQGFPYCVYYREESGQISVLAVVHNARDPAVWEHRT